MTGDDLSRTLMSLTGPTQEARVISSGQLQIRAANADRWVTLGRRSDTRQMIINAARVAGFLPS